MKDGERTELADETREHHPYRFQKLWSPESSTTAGGWGSKFLGTSPIFKLFLLLGNKKGSVCVVAPDKLLFGPGKVGLFTDWLVPKLARGVEPPGKSTLCVTRESFGGI